MTCPSGSRTKNPVRNPRAPWPIPLPSRSCSATAPPQADHHPALLLGLQTPGQAGLLPSREEYRDQGPPFLARSNSLLATSHSRSTLSQKTPCNMTLNPNHPDVEKQEIVRIDGKVSHFALWLRNGPAKFTIEAHHISLVQTINRVESHESEAPS